MEVFEGLPWQSNGQDFSLSLLRAQVQSLVMERSPPWCGKKEKLRKDSHLCFIIQNIFIFRSINTNWNSYSSEVFVPKIRFSLATAHLFLAFVPLTNLIKYVLAYSSIKRENLCKYCISFLTHIFTH